MILLEERTRISNLTSEEVETERIVLEDYITRVEKKVGLDLISQGKGEGFNLVVNTNEVAGQIVPHFHAHIIPRKEGDGLRGFYLEKKD